MPYANLVLSDATKIRLMPLRGISLFHPASNNPDDGNTFTEFSNLEPESSFALRMITRVDSFGQERTVAYRWEITGYCPQNNYKDLLHRLEFLRRLKRGVDVQMLLGTEDGPQHSSPSLGPINSNAGAWVSVGPIYSLPDTNGIRFRFNYEIEGVEYRPRLIVKMSGLIHTLVSLIESDQSIWSTT